MGRSYPCIYAAAGGGAGSFTPILMIALLFGVMYFMMIRPQQKRRREAEQMQSALGPGDEVVTIGGLYGTVTGVDDDTVLSRSLRACRPASPARPSRGWSTAPSRRVEPVSEDADPVKD